MTTARVLHVVQQLSRGGAARAFVAAAACQQRAGMSTHHVLSLLPDIETGARRLAADADLPVVAGADDASAGALIAAADIVHVHYWNTPELVAFLQRLTSPARVVLTCHVPGDTPPHVLHPEMIVWADVTIADGPYGYALPVFRDLDERTRAEHTGLVIDTPDFSRLAQVTPRPHAGFTVGYIGTVDPVKMHPAYVAMSAAVDVPDVRFIVCGNGSGFAALQKDAAARGVLDRFEFRGYVEDIASVLAELDVFGYPVTHSAIELVLQEAMFAGVPPVVLATDGAARTVDHGRTGLVVDNADAYARAIERLYRDPVERRRLGANAAAHARQAFGAERAAEALAEIYERVMRRPKRARVWPFPNRATARSGDAVRSVAAWTFADMMGATAARPFLTSLTSADVPSLLDAEAAIAAAPPVIADGASGGVIHYRRCYPSDPHLRLWTGLVLGAQGRPALAIAELEAARRLGLDHWRVSWYIAQLARATGAVPLARQALDRALAAAPEFQPAVDARAELAEPA
ncbi:MAG TPA: glycosyltransferase family 4 protein [Vicinamibacterales bacterium]|nr:glycosyltransferase family 4 protein [Vicinamibacterales bacterium]